jgi:hypothetical protein
MSPTSLCPRRYCLTPANRIFPRRFGCVRRSKLDQSTRRFFACLGGRLINKLMEDDLKRGYPTAASSGHNNVVVENCAALKIRTNRRKSFGGFGAKPDISVPS